MATHQSAIKRYRQNLKRRARNVDVKSAVKSAIKEVKDTAKAGNKEKAKTALTAAIKLLDKAVSAGTLHRNNASRKISSLTLAVNAIAAK
ncbi:MAG TPA: 30S ribosomal protein S20 [Deltaproteobacteria bacterium]|nr:30S ribosomal protein S20 [Deltaproteobacteria bacterium]